MIVGNESQDYEFVQEALARLKSITMDPRTLAYGHRQGRQVLVIPGKAQYAPQSGDPCQTTTQGLLP